MLFSDIFSPTAAAKAVVVRSQVNGWNFWYIEDVNGDKMKLSKYAEQISGSLVKANGNCETNAANCIIGGVYLPQLLSL